MFPSHPGWQQHRDTARTLNTDVTPRSADGGLSGSSVELAHLGGKQAAAARDGGKGNRSSGLEGRALSSHLLVRNLKRRQVAGAHSWACREPPNEGVCSARHFAPRCRVELLALPKWDPPTARGFAEPFQVTEQGCLGLTPPLCWP